MIWPQAHTSTGTNIAVQGCVVLTKRISDDDTMTGALPRGTADWSHREIFTGEKSRLNPADRAKWTNAIGLSRWMPDYSGSSGFSRVKTPVQFRLPFSCIEFWRLPFDVRSVDR